VLTLEMIGYVSKVSVKLYVVCSVGMLPFLFSAERAFRYHWRTIVLYMRQNANWRTAGLFPEFTRSWRHTLRPPSTGSSSSVPLWKEEQANGGIYREEGIEFGFPHRKWWSWLRLLLLYTRPGYYLAGWLSAAGKPS